MIRRSRHIRVEFLGRGFDLDPNGLRFLTLESAAARPGPPRIVLAPGWARDLLTPER